MHLKRVITSEEGVVFCSMGCSFTAGTSMTKTCATVSFMMTLANIDQFYGASASRAQYGFTISVRLSVCHVVVLYLNEGIYRKTFPPSGSNIILVFEPHRCYKIPSGTPSAQV